MKRLMVAGLVALVLSGNAEAQTQIDRENVFHEIWNEVIVPFTVIWVRYTHEDNSIQEHDHRVQSILNNDVSIASYQGYLAGLILGGWWAPHFPHNTYEVRQLEYSNQRGSLLMLMYWGQI